MKIRRDERGKRGVEDREEGSDEGRIESREKKEKVRERSIEMQQEGGRDGRGTQEIWDRGEKWRRTGGRSR